MSLFSFKQFSVEQRNCAMKINTDGVLLGALADHNDPKRILDIGTGTGVVALMLAQRFPNANLDAVEIEEHAAATAGYNFELSPFESRIRIHAVDFMDYRPNEIFELIVSNPPFFVNDKKSEDRLKSLARHASQAFYNNLMERCSEMLSDDGKFWLVLPVEQAELMTASAGVYGLSLCENINIRSFRNKVIFRRIICFCKGQRPLKSSEVVIYDSPGLHSAQYNTLLKDFFPHL